MLNWLKRWLGWDSEPSLWDFSDLRLRPPPQTPPVNAPRLGARVPRARAKPAAQQAPAGAAQKSPAGAPQKAPASAPQKAATPSPKKRPRSPLDLLDNPQLTIDKPADDGFDPYNTGAFNRSAKWEKIGRQR
jgi:hypothetical protein